MPYLQVDLDAMDKWPLVATGCDIRTDTVYKGFLDLWQLCWRQKSGFVGLLHLECLFGMAGRGERLVEVLCAFGFLERRAEGLWVSGSEKYLRISEARSAGGKKAAANGNLKRGTKRPSSSRKPAGKQLEVSPSTAPALTANTEHHSSSSKKEDPAKGAGPPPEKPFALESPDKPKSKPRAQSTQEQFAQYFWGVRADVMAQKQILGGPETGWSVERQNTQLGFVKTHPPDLLQEAVAQFFESEKMATKDPPYPLHLFVADFATYESKARRRGAA